MNIQNFEYLRNQLFYCGFGHKLEDALRSKMAKDKQEFQLQYRGQIDSEPVRAELHFSRSRQTDRYYFNSFRVELPQNSARVTGSRRFQVNGSNRFTLKEAYNLLNGRSVHKELTNVQGERYRAWFQLDGKTLDIQGNHKLLQFHENYGYDIENQLGRFPIMELREEQSKKRLLESLGRGNRQLVTFELSSGPHKLYVEALPRFKAVCIYNEQGIRQEFIDDRSKLDQRPSAKLQEQQRQIQIRSRGGRKGHSL
ncbi:hypothetical protein SMI01S_01710 [Sphingobacterium mizutaii NBRC 14946 = DSM 11724]|uniref:Uncharacterized protein n=2 Tax=Sphingobacterium mizutaii TaxID=1010 RepID=A0AAJ5C210_9SPHI|nr:hypothetical protein [Sphingobacterium mizutaii]GEM66565.1 hypothetical protein SMI01S_01710 [Sphingobacterium mizutaii NBRC 14946 = DSM 11724]SDL51189.1 hypothetical protein SAMN05192578_104189 [Sphingobacterium mizutaii]SNV61886.1 Uncharacterised protein [Sphingobacterium mizutaii]